MGQHYSHLSLFERQRIFHWFHEENKSKREIARLLDRAHSTILREINRNKTHYERPYWYPNCAHRISLNRRSEANKHARLKNEKTRNFVIEHLKMGWSPELISGRLKHLGKPDYVCHEAIYQYIYKEDSSLTQYLARAHKRRRQKYPYRKAKERIPNKVSILDRPEEVNNRSEFGHWESDSIESKNRNSGLNVLLERRTRLVKITKLKSKTSLETKLAIETKLKLFPDVFIKSITYDNGKENVRHSEINDSLNLYFLFLFTVSQLGKRSC